jgi:AraC-like DNA-binding protein
MVLHSQTVLARDGVALYDIACRHGQGRGHEIERSRAHMLVFVRRGCFVERAIALTARVLECADSRRVAACRPETARRRRAVVDSVREALAAEPELSLPELAREVPLSPHHLSRTFHSITGHTISRHRMRLRARAALERLAGGEHDLARLAADLGFADQSHLCRVLRSETGRVPSALRQMLGHLH